MYGAIIAELESFYKFHDAQDLWEDSIGANIERNKFYNDSVFKNLVHLLAIRLNKEPKQILQSFGEFITPYLLKLFPINTDRDIIDLLSNVEREVEPYRDEIQMVDTSPFNISKVNGRKIDMIYDSRKDMPELRKGIILGLAREMEQNIDVSIQKLEDNRSLISVEVVN